MKRLVTLVLVLAACAAPQVRDPREGPTELGQNDLTLLASFFTGNWDPKAGEPPVRMRAVEFWKGSPARWLYLEWVDIANEVRPTRQLVFRIAEDGEQRLKATVHALPGDRLRFAGEWRKPQPFASLRPQDLREVEGCRLGVVRSMIAHFLATTEGNRCPSGRPEFPFVRYEFSLAASELDLYEQARNAAGNAVPGPLKLSRLQRMSREPH